MTYYTPDQWRGTALGKAGRDALRAAVGAHAGWPQHRADLGLSHTGDLTTAELIDVALALSIDIAAVTGRTPDGCAPVLAAAAGEHHKPRPHGRAEVDALQARFVRVADTVMSARDRDFCAAIFRTIDDKQEGSATAKQFACVTRALERAEAKAGDQHQTPPADVAMLDAKQAIADRILKDEPAMNAHAAPNADAAGQLATLIAQLAGQAMNPAAVRDLVQAEIKAALENGPVLRIEVKGRDGEVRQLEGKQHPKMPSLLRAAGSRMASGYAPNIWLSGPAGSGKTHAGHQLADALGLDFHLNGALSMPHELTGFIDAGGTYHRTPFREAYEHGGVYMFDEVDGSDNAALLALNAALANGYATFPDAKVKRHPDCIIVASANTWGLGATAEYVGRAKIDAAFLSRFPVRLHWQYDEELEAAICGNPQWARRVQRARDKAAAAGLKVLIDPRASQAGAALIAAGASFDEAAAETYLANLTADQRRLIEG